MGLGAAIQTEGRSSTDWAATSLTALLLCTFAILELLLGLLSAPAQPIEYHTLFLIKSSFSRTTNCRSADNRLA